MSPMSNQMAPGPPLTNGPSSGPNGPSASNTPSSGQGMNMLPNSGLLSNYSPDSPYPNQAKSPAGSQMNGPITSPSPSQVNNHKIKQSDIGNIPSVLLSPVYPRWFKSVIDFAAGLVPLSLPNTEIPSTIGRAF